MKMAPSASHSSLSLSSTAWLLTHRDSSCSSSLMLVCRAKPTTDARIEKTAARRESTYFTKNTVGMAEMRWNVSLRHFGFDK